jgi:dCMP deaminase
MNTKEYDAYLLLNQRQERDVVPQSLSADKRPSWERYFMDMAVLASRRSSCERRKVGAVAVKDKRILAVGYNGAPSGLAHCGASGGCWRQKHNIPSGQKRELCRAIHAEQNLLIQAAIHGISLHGCDVYCNCSPCSDCAKMMISLGVKNFYFLERYPDELVDGFIADPGTKMKLIHVADGMF